MSISDDTTELLRVLFPSIDHSKIIRAFYSIQGHFSSVTNKEPLITFMPRKLPGHSERVYFYLRSQIPERWSISPVVNFTEAEVASILARSSIFMSFSELEGLPLPPLEAAISGNIVVGYTGEGGKEYFHRPIFREVASGDLREYVRCMLDAISDVEKGALNSLEISNQREAIRESYSKDRELSRLREIAYLVDKIMNSGRARSDSDTNVAKFPIFSPELDKGNALELGFSHYRRNESCPCGSGKRYKHCHGRKH